MTKKQTWACPQCDEEFELKPDYTVYNLKDQEVCEGCQENDFQYASKLFKFSPDEEPSQAIFSEYFVHQDETNVYESCEELPVPVKSQVWEKTDGWRGYTDWKLLPGYKEYAGGWVTGSPDATTERKAKIAEYFNDLHEGKLIPPCTIYWLFGNTSNVFSQMSMIVIREEDEMLVDAWIDEINGTPDEFKERFN